MEYPTMKIHNGLVWVATASSGRATSGKPDDEAIDHTGQQQEKEQQHVPLLASTERVLTLLRHPAPKVDELDYKPLSAEHLMAVMKDAVAEKDASTEAEGEADAKTTSEGEGGTVKEESDEKSSMMTGKKETDENDAAPKTPPVVVDGEQDTKGDEVNDDENDAAPKTPPVVEDGEQDTQGNKVNDDGGDDKKPSNDAGQGGANDDDGTGKPETSKNEETPVVRSQDAKFQSLVDAQSLADLMQTALADIRNLKQRNYDRSTSNSGGTRTSREDRRNRALEAERDRLQKHRGQAALVTGLAATAPSATASAEVGAGQAADSKDESEVEIVFDPQSTEPAATEDVAPDADHPAADEDEDDEDDAYQLEDKDDAAGEAEDEDEAEAEDDHDDGGEEQENGWIRLARTVNSLRILTPIYLQILFHPKRNDEKLVIGTRALYTSALAKRKPRCWVLGEHVFSTATVRLFKNIYASLQELMEHFGVNGSELTVECSRWEDALVTAMKEGFDSAGSSPNSATEKINSRLLGINIPSARAGELDKKYGIVPNDASDDEKAEHGKYEQAIHKVRSRLQEVLEESFSDCRVSVYGSCLSDLSLGKSSDVDMSLNIKEFEKLRDEFQRGDMTPANYQKERRSLVLQVTRKLGGLTTEFAGMEPVHQARVPVVRGRYLSAGNPYSGDGSIDFDICFSNDIAVTNSSLLRQYSLVDPRVRQLMISVKQWTKANGINSARTDFLSSYAWINMVIFYLQYIDLVPNLQSPRLMKEVGVAADPSNPEHCVNEHDTFFLKWDQAKTVWTQSKQLESKSVTELLYGFFHFYTHAFSSAFYAVSIKRGKDSLLPKTAFRRGSFFFCIEDPFETFDSHVPHDLGTTVITTKQRLIFQSIQDAEEHTGKILMSASNGEEVTIDTLWPPVDEKKLKEREQQVKNRGGRNNRRGGGQQQRQNGRRPQQQKRDEKEQDTTSDGKENAGSSNNGQQRNRRNGKSQNPRGRRDQQQQQKKQQGDETDGEAMPTDGEQTSDDEGPKERQRGGGGNGRQRNNRPRNRRKPNNNNDSNKADTKGEEPATNKGDDLNQDGSGDEQEANTQSPQNRNRGNRRGGGRNNNNNNRNNNRQKRDSKEEEEKDDGATEEEDNGKRSSNNNRRGGGRGRNNGPTRGPRNANNNDADDEDKDGVTEEEDNGKTRVNDGNRNNNRRGGGRGRNGPARGPRNSGEAGDETEDEDTGNKNKNSNKGRGRGRNNQQSTQSKADVDSDEGGDEFVDDATKRRNNNNFNNNRRGGGGGGNRSRPPRAKQSDGDETTQATSSSSLEKEMLNGRNGNKGGGNRRNNGRRSGGGGAGKVSEETSDDREEENVGSEDDANDRQRAPRNRNRRRNNNNNNNGNSDKNGNESGVSDDDDDGGEKGQGNGGRNSNNGRRRNNGNSNNNNNRNRGGRRQQGAGNGGGGEREAERDAVAEGVVAVVMPTTADGRIF